MGHFSVEIMRLPGQLSVEINNDFGSHDDAAAIYVKIEAFLEAQEFACFDLENVRDAITMAQIWSSGGKLKS